MNICMTRKYVKRPYSKAEDSVGQKFGMLTVTGLLNFDKFGNRKVLCICDCGNEKKAALYKLRNGDTRSCGCLQKQNANKQLEKAAANNPNLLKKQEPRLATAKNTWRNRYSDGNLSFDDFMVLSQQNCFYCGCPPSNRTNCYLTKDNRYSEIRQLSGYFIYSGLDRIDSNLPHNLDNVVPSCIRCNKAKLEQSKEHFFAWISKVYELHCKPACFNSNGYPGSNTKSSHIGSDEYGSMECLSQTNDGYERGET